MSNAPSVSVVLQAIAVSLVASLILTPTMRWLAVKFNVLDHPSSPVKTHTHPVPYLGGAAIFVSFAAALVWVRFHTEFLSGTLRSLRGILFGAGMMFVLGLIDDVKKFGLHYRTKFLFQIAAACMLILFGIRIRFINPPWLAYIVTMIWVVGVTNAFNLVDIMDGLSSSIAIVSTMAFLVIALPSEEIYVNVAAAALCGATLGFLPFNLSKRFRIFMGDAGSLVLGFICSALALGTSYGREDEWGVFAPLLILCLPIFDTLFVFAMRIMRGISPFLGSKDHYAIRMEMMGWTRPTILLFTVLFSMVLSLAAFAITWVPVPMVFYVYGCVVVILVIFTSYLLKVKISER